MFNGQIPFRWFASLVLATLASLLILSAAAQAHSPGNQTAAPRSGILAPNVDTPTATPTCGPPAWTTQASYPTPTTFHAVTSHGGLVYSFGGVANSLVVTNSYVYNPGTNAWTAIAPLPAVRQSAGAVSDGTYIYILGGFDGGGNVTSTLYRYNPATNSYTTLAAAPNPNANSGLALLGGKIYRVAGCTFGCTFASTVVDAYNIATNTWAASGSIAAYPENEIELNVVSNGTYLYAAGGTTSGGTTTKTYRYDPVANAWNDGAITDLPEGRYHAAGGLVNGHFVLAGGATTGATNSVISLELNSPTGAWFTHPNLPVARWRAEGAVLGINLYSVAGRDTSNQATADVYRFFFFPCPISYTPTGTNTSTPTNTPTRTNTRTSTSTPTITYTPSNTPTRTNTPTITISPTISPTPTCGPATWSARASYPSVVYKQAVVAHGGRIYSFGGNLPGTTANSYVYDPGTDVWAPIAPLPSARSGSGAVSDGTYIYIVNGDGPSGASNTLYRYNPATNAYNTLAAGPRATNDHGTAIVGGKIYRVGGCAPLCDGSGTTTVDVYDIATNTWAPAGTIAAYPTNVVEVALATDGTNLYGIGGQVAGAAIAKTYRYDSAGNTWNDLAITDLPQPLFGAAYGLLNGRFVLAGGNSTSVVSLALSAPAGAWVSQPDMPASRWRVSGAGTGYTFFTVGGLDDEPVRTSGVYRLLDFPCPATSTPTITNTPPPTATPTITRTPSNTPTNTPTITPTPSNTPTATLTPYPTCYSNVALGKPASQSSTDFGGFEDRAVDGNTDGNFSNYSVTHTDNENQPWWQVDLGQVVQVATVDLWNRTDCCSERLSNFDLLWSQDGASWSSIYFPGTAGTRTTFTVNALARYVKVQLRDVGLRVLSLAEVQVWVCAPPTPTVTSTPTSTNTATATLTRTITPTNSPTRTFTATNTATMTPVPTGTATRTSTQTPSNTPANTSTATNTPTNVPTNTFTPGVTSTPAAVLVGHVTWQGPPNQPNPMQQLPISLTLRSGATQVDYSGLTTDPSGYLTVGLGTLPSGTYEWRAKGPKYLANSGTVALTGGSLVAKEMGTMRVGDANNDNVVEILDFNILKATFGRFHTDPSYDDRADFTGDQLVDTLDFNELKSNFGSAGAPPLLP